MSDLYAFVDQYIREQFEQEKVLSETTAASVCRLRHRESHRRYICRRYCPPVEGYLILKDVSCDHLPRIYEAVTGRESVCSDGKAGVPGMIVLEEYIQGDTLDELLQNGPLTGKQARSIALQVCRGLYALHAKNLVHRDVKPENVILDGDRAVLIDFDAVRRFHPEQEKDTQVLGTVGYAPPEQYGISGTDERADIYAMGVMINEMLTGQHPSRTLAKGRWGHIVSRCTMIQPKKRYQTVYELMEAL